MCNSSLVPALANDIFLRPVLCPVNSPLDFDYINALNLDSMGEDLGPQLLLLCNPLLPSSGGSLLLQLDLQIQMNLPSVGVVGNG